MENNLIEIKLSPVQYHLFNGGWKIHHILSDEIFKSSSCWSGMKIHTGVEGAGSRTIHSEKSIITQDIEIVPGNHNDLHYWRILIDKKLAVEQKRFSCQGSSFLSEIMKNEGLTAYEFHNEKFDLHSKNLKYFSGKIIHFTQFKYH